MAPKKRRCSDYFNCSTFGWPYFFLSLCYVFCSVFGPHSFFVSLELLVLLPDKLNNILFYVDGLPELIFLDVLQYLIFLFLILTCLVAKNITFVALGLGWFCILFSEIIKDPNKCS